MMFVRHNAAPWQEPHNWAFEPSPVWHDGHEMAVDESAKIFLRNVLGKSKIQGNELKQEVDKKRREVENTKRVRQKIQEGKDNRDEVELVRAMFSIQDDLHQIERKRITSEVETLTIIAAVGDISLGAQNHEFKSETFKIPTNCDLCGDRIWGLSAKGFNCRDCGYTCHSKCELKVPAQCPGEQSKEDKKRLKTERQAAANIVLTTANGNPPDGVSELPALSRSNTMNSLSSGYAASANRSVSGTGVRTPNDDSSPVDRTPSAPPAATKPNTLRKNRVVAPPPAQYVSEMPANELNGGGATSLLPSSNPKSSEARGKMLYPYQATGESELSVDEGQEVTIVEPDGPFLSFPLSSFPHH